MKAVSSILLLGSILMLALPAVADQSVAADSHPANGGPASSAAAAPADCPAPQDRWGILTKKADKTFARPNNKVHGVAAAIVGNKDLTAPGYAQDDAWPDHRSSDADGVYHIVWSDGTISNVVRGPDGGYRIIGGDESGTTITPFGSGKYAITTGDGGEQAVMSPLPGGGYTIISGDGTAINLYPRLTGGWDMDQGGVSLGSVISGPDGSRYGFGSSSFSFSI